MYIIVSFNQLEEALRSDVQEILVVGRIATQVQKAFEEKQSIQEWKTLQKNVIATLRNQYSIVNYQGNQKDACLILQRH